MKADIQTRDDMHKIVTLFYEKLFADDFLKPIFEGTVKDTLAHHLDVVANFWASMLLDADVYRGNPMIKHIELNQKFKLTKSEFDQWLFLWKQSVDELYSGTIATQTKDKAQHIAELMLYKIDAINQGKI